MAVLEVVRVPARTDNYIWLVHDAASQETVVVDPAEAQVVLDAADQRGWQITQIWNTHWHGDHVGGNADIKAATGCRISGPRGDAARIPNLDVQLADGDSVRLGNHVATVMAVPAHTAGHIAFHMPQDKLLFVGDTLFAMGCGRLFEGTAEQMFSALRRFAALPDDTVVYCAHEYTESNGVFSVAMAPDDEAIAARLQQVRQVRSRDEATVPTTIGLERMTNLFMRAPDIAEFARLRAAKDNF